MRRTVALWGIVCALVLSLGCAAAHELLSGPSDYDRARRFWDQTSDDPFR